LAQLGVLLTLSRNLARGNLAQVDSVHGHLLDGDKGQKTRGALAVALPVNPDVSRIDSGSARLGAFAEKQGHLRLCGAGHWLICSREAHIESHFATWKRKAGHGSAHALSNQLLWVVNSLYFYKTALG
jgi:hypothetical protein